MAAGRATHRASKSETSFHRFAKPQAKTAQDRRSAQLILGAQHAVSDPALRSGNK